MAGLKLFDHISGPVECEYDNEADTLYVSFGSPRPAVGVDVGGGVIVRFDEQAREVVGLTVVGIGSRLGDGLDRRASGRAAD